MSVHGELKGLSDSDKNNHTRSIHATDRNSGKVMQRSQTSAGGNHVVAHWCVNIVNAYMNKGCICALTWRIITFAMECQREVYVRGLTFPHHSFAHGVRTS